MVKLWSKNQNVFIIILIWIRNNLHTIFILHSILRLDWVVFKHYIFNITVCYQFQLKKKKNYVQSTGTPIPRIFFPSFFYYFLIIYVYNFSNVVLTLAPVVFRQFQPYRNVVWHSWLLLTILLNINMMVFFRLLRHSSFP